jgi:hypothetical protein
MAKKSPSDGFPTVNLIPDRDRVRYGSRPTVRGRFIVALAVSMVLLLAVVFVQLVPTLAARGQ